MSWVFQQWWWSWLQMLALSIAMFFTAWLSAGDDPGVQASRERRRERKRRKAWRAEAIHRAGSMNVWATVLNWPEGQELIVFDRSRLPQWLVREHPTMHLIDVVMLDFGPEGG